MARLTLVVAIAFIVATFSVAAAQSGSSIDDPVPMGTAASVGEYTVTVTGYDADASDELVARNEENVPPEDGYVYALISFDVTYDGVEVGKASNLNWQFVGSNRASLTETACSSGDRTLASGSVDDASRDADIFPGGSVEYDACVYLTVEDAQNVVMYTQNPEGERVFFALEEGEADGTPEATPAA